MTAVEASEIEQERGDRDADPRGSAATLPRHVTVIGGAGYVGSVLIRKLLRQIPAVTVMDALMFGDEGVRDLMDEPGFNVVRGDLRDIESIVRSLRDADAVVHLGGLVGDPACALDESLTMEINMESTRMIAETARGLGVERFVFASSCAVYGATDELLDEESALAPVSVYARSKMESERLLLDLADETFAPSILRFGTFFGLSPRNRFDLVVNMLTAKAVTEGGITVFGGGQWRPFVHVEDGSEAIVRCLAAPIETVRGRVYNVGSDEENHTMLEVADRIAALVPGALVIREPAAKEEPNYRVSFRRIREELGFVAEHSLDDAVLEIVDAIHAGEVEDYKDARYSNYASMTNGAGTVLRRRREAVRLEEAG